MGSRDTTQFQNAAPRDFGGFACRRWRGCPAGAAAAPPETWKPEMESFGMTTTGLQAN